MSRSHSLAWRGFSRLRGFIAATLVIAAIGGTPPSAVAAYPKFTFSGGGYGHGIGLSQYGAKGFAERGKSGTWIIAHYFPGTVLSSIGGKSVKVNLDPTAAYGPNDGYSSTRWRVRAGWPGMGISLNGGASLPDSAGPYAFEVSSNRIKVTDKNGRQVAGSPFATSVAITMKGSASPALLQVVGRSGPFKNSSSASGTNVRYRGKLVIRSNGSRLKLLNQLPIERYLYGVVPRESPSSWHMEALKAQAIAARSYAAAAGGELYCDTRSQVYNGYSHGVRTSSSSYMHETARTNSAVDSTAAKYVTYGGKVVSTYFSSSSGGYTANKVDIWGGTEIPYLRGVPDPYGSGSYDPWTTRVTMNGKDLGAAIAKRISGEPSGAGTSVYVKSVSVTHAWPSGFATSVKVGWSNGATSSGISAGTWRLALGLKSNKFFSNANGDRIAGHDRYAVSVSASKRAFPSIGSAQSVVVANADSEAFSDAACAAELAGIAHGPLLLVRRDSLPSDVAAEIKRLNPSTLYVVGSTSVVSAGVASKLHALGPAIVRLGGKDRYATSALVARKAVSLGADPKRVVVASGTAWRDASVAAALAGGSNRPLLLTSGRRLSSATAAALKEFGTRKTIVVGGTSLSAGTVKSILTITKQSQPSRRFGLTGTRYDLAVAAASFETTALGFSRSTVYAASGTKLPDALVTSALSAVTRHPFVFAGTYTPPSATRRYLTAGHSSISKVTVVGRPTVIGLACAFRLMSDAY